MGRQQGAPRRPRGCGPRIDPSGGSRDTRGGSAHPPGAVRPRGARDDHRRLEDSRRAGGGPRRPRGGEPHRCRPSRGAGWRAVRRGDRLRGEVHAGRSRGYPRRCVGVRGRPRQCRPGRRPEDAGAHPRTSLHRGRRDHLRLHRKRRPAAGMRERRGGGDQVGGRLRRPFCNRPEPPRHRRGDEAGEGRVQAGERRGGPAAGGGGRRERRSLPEGARRVPGRLGSGGAREGPRSLAGDDEQPPPRRPRLGVLRDDRRRGRVGVRRSRA
ncbi:MAG: hypothetical protein KatS3mg008_0588 [Acidimicrobiales bacterium]|nr:MAG: hypothetical protein KatS3mg008_0588 [Acidimicrobiales bacterium]